MLCEEGALTLDKGAMAQKWRQGVCFCICGERRCLLETRVAGVRGARLN